MALVGRPALAAVGGFICSGKTEIILSAARLLMSSGTSVAAVLPHEKRGSLDAEYLTFNGISTAALNGAEALDTAQSAMAFTNAGADIVFVKAEAPRPDIRRGFLDGIKTGVAGDMRMLPYTVVASPGQVEGNIRDSGGLSPYMNYILATQMEEADILLLSVADDEDEKRAAYIEKALEDRFAARIMTACPYSGRGMSEWLDCILSGEYLTRERIKADDGAYERAARETGCLNTRLTVKCDEGADMNSFVMSLAERVSDGVPYGAAQIKVCAFAETGVAKAGSQARSSAPTLVSGMSAAAREAVVMLEVKAAMPSRRLAYMAEMAICGVCDDFVSEGYNMGSEYFELGGIEPVASIG
ncbi:MAG: hypothetical protein ACOYJD_03550 [Christensenellales bacterium]|jgi:hypothetical protein